MSQPRSPKSEPIDFVSAQPGFIVSLLFISFAIILGLAFRLYFSPDRVQAWVEAALARESKALEIKVEKSTVSLANGSFPHFAIQLNGVRTFLRDGCPTQPILEINQVYLPLRLFDLMRGRISLGTVNGQSASVNVYAFRRDCQAGQLTKVSTPREEVLSPNPGPSKIDDISMIVEKLSTTQPRIDKLNVWWNEKYLGHIARSVKGIQFDLVHVHLNQGTKQSIDLEEFALKAKPEGPTMQLTADLRLSQKVAFGENLAPLQVRINLNPHQLEAFLDGNIKEGRIKAAARIHRHESKATFLSDFEVHNVPLATLLPVARSWLRTPINFHPKFMWFSCSMKMNGDMSETIATLPLRIQNCKIEGESGLVEIAAIERMLDGSWKPFTIEMENLDIKKILEMADKIGPTGLFSNFGVVNGTLSVDLKKPVALFNGEINGSEIFFSSGNVRGKQVVSSATFDFEYSREGMKGALTRLALANGSVNAKVNFIIDQTLKDGQVDVAVSDLKFDPAVEKLMLQGEAQGLNLEGKLKIQQSRIDTWNGQIEIKSINGSIFQASDIKLKTRFTEDVFHIEARSPSGSVMQKATGVAFLQPLFTEIKQTKRVKPSAEQPSEWLKLKDLSAEISVQGPAWHWEKARAVVEDGGVQILSEGGWNETHHLIGWVQMIRPHARTEFNANSKSASKIAQWHLQGKTDHPLLVDITATASEIAALQSDQARASRVTEVMKKSADNLGKLGQQVIEKAKEIIPGMKKPTTEKSPDEKSEMKEAAAQSAKKSTGKAPAGAQN